MATAATPAPEAPVSSNSIGRLFGVLFSPKPTFESIAQRPTWLLPLITLCVLSAAIVGIFGQRVGWRNFIADQDRQNSRVEKRMEQMKPEQREKMLDQQAKYAPILAYVSVVLGTFVGAIVVAAVLLGAFNLVRGTKIDFATSLGIVSYSWTPYIILSVLGVLILFLKDPSAVDLEHLVASNPGAFLSEDAPKWLNSLLTSLDIFTVWTMILAAFGFRAASPKKLSTGKAFATILAVWIVYVLAKAGITAAFS